MSAQRLVIATMRLSSTRSFHCLPDLPVNSNRNVPPLISTCLRRIVVRAVGFVLAHIFGVCATRINFLEQADDGGQHFSRGRPSPLHIGRDLAPQLARVVGKLHDMFIFVLIAQFAPLGMITVLLAAPRVEAGRRIWPLAEGQIQTASYPGGIPIALDAARHPCW